MSECQCEIDGPPRWCERHHCRKTSHWRMLCQTREDYRVLWEAGRGPGQHSQADGPSFSAKVRHFMTAIARWTAAGCPTRTDDQVAAILETHCQPCEFYTGEICRHKRCGCKINLSRWQNKLRWATESCPIGKWGQS